MRFKKRQYEMLCMVLLGFCLVFMLYFRPPRALFASFSLTLNPDHSKKTTSPTASPPRTQKHAKPVMVVVVSSNPRSGSSFLGQLLASPANAVYFYEPFRYAREIGQTVNKTSHLSPEESKRNFVQNELLKLLSCQLTEEMFTMPFHIWHKPTLAVPPTAVQRAAICHDLDIRIAKVIRPGLGGVLPLLKLQDQNINVIHLVRDPRGIVNSVRQINNWGKILTAEKVCDRFAFDLDAARNITSRRLTMVRYEDLIADTTKEARRLFDRLGLNMTEDVEMFISMHTNSTKEPRHRNRLGNLFEHLYNKLAKPAQSSSGKSAAHSDTWRQSPTAELPHLATRRRRRSAGSRGQRWQATVSFNDTYGTFREASFDGMHWLKELPKDVRSEVERKCEDVLKRLGYPLLYPGEN